MDEATLADFARSLEQDYGGTLRRFLSLQARGGEDARTVIATLRAKLSERDAPSPASLRAGLAILHDADLRAEVPRVTAATLVIHGTHDTLTPPGAGRWLAETLPCARWLPVAGAAHAPFLSHRPRVAAELERFLHG